MFNNCKFDGELQAVALHFASHGLKDDPNFVVMRDLKHKINVFRPSLHLDKVNDLITSIEIDVSSRFVACPDYEDIIENIACSILQIQRACEENGMESGWMNVAKRTVKIIYNK